MYIPDSSSMALALILLSMLCWGSWANLLKALPGWRLEYFYVDFTIGFLLSMVLIGVSVGSAGSAQPDFFDRVFTANAREVLFAFAGGLLWNAGNILLLNSIMIAGLAVAFPIACVLGITLGVGIGYWAQPIGNPTWLFIGSIALVVAGWCNAQAYRNLDGNAGARSGRGITLALAAGGLIGIFPPFVGAALSGNHALDAYSVCLYFMLGAAVATVIGVPALLAKPLIGAPSNMRDYRQGPKHAHALGVLAGAIWCAGTVSNFISAGIVGIAISWGIGNGAPMVAALWGIFLWKEFQGASRGARSRITASLFLYIIGIALVAIAYQYR